MQASAGLCATYGARLAAETWLVALPLRLRALLRPIGFLTVAFGFDGGAI